MRPYTRWTGVGAVGAATDQNTHWSASSRTSPRWWIRSRRRPDHPSTCTVTHTAGPNPAVFALPAGLEERMDALLAAGDPGAVVETLFRELEAMSDEDMEAFKAAPSWPGRVAAAHTVTRECRGELQARLDPQLAAKITVPVLLLVGENSSDPARPDVEAVAAALPDARIVVLDEQEHVADVLVPEIFAEHLFAFLRDHGSTAQHRPRASSPPPTS
jgi:pimeloyl-ACP methyl ester carboxylesterase